MHIEGTINLLVLLDDLHARATPGVGDNFIVPILLGTLYIGQLISRVFWLER